jgi:hypothetical protein
METRRFQKDAHKDWVIYPATWIVVVSVVWARSLAVPGPTMCGVPSSLQTTHSLDTNGFVLFGPPIEAMTKLSSKLSLIVLDCPY